MTSIDVSNRRDLQHVIALAEKVTARCDACGASWTYERHDALACPMCAAHFTIAHFSALAPATYVEFEAVGGATRARPAR